MPFVFIHYKKNILSQYEQVSDNVLLYTEPGERVNAPLASGHA